MFLSRVIDGVVPDRPVGNETAVKDRLPIAIPVSREGYGHAVFHRNFDIGSRQSDGTGDIRVARTTRTSNSPKQLRLLFPRS